MIIITFTSEYFSGKQSFTEDKKAEQFLKMLKKNHDIAVKPVQSTNYHLKKHNIRVRNGFYVGASEVLKEVPTLKINIEHDTN